MEFPGCCFEDSVFSETRERVPQSGTPYTARQCEPQWFNKHINSADCTEITTVLKFRGDLAYKQEDYQKALDEYQNCIMVLPGTNAAMRRDVQESQARCLLHLRRYTEALQITETLKKVVSNTDHLTCALNLQITVYSHLGDLDKTLSCLQQLVSLHPFNPWIWKRLAEFYMRLYVAVLDGKTSQNFNNFNRANNCTPAAEEGSEEQPCFIALFSRMGAFNQGVDSQLQGHTGESAMATLTSTALGREQLWINASASFIRARLLLQLIQPQQTSFVLDKNVTAQLHIGKQLNMLGLQEETQMLISELMSEDLSPEGLREEGQIDTKSTLALTSFQMPSDAEFTAKWFNKISSSSVSSFTYEDKP
ncbi:uncharacterized protein C8orf76 homolog [Spea bombifrons]|uniref:uncharacterized protein C8orf76 homolog n=1 Tax=Spea bombifrons TaxID=233779 RepID=UPI00234A22A7|nr:uncharacterized protein C8orf76 homolog [Spea bombifrons]